MKMNLRAWLVIGSGILISCALNGARAEQKGDEAAYAFTGHFLLTSPCTVNYDGVKETSFNNAGVNKVDGVNSLKLIPYTINCQSTQESSVLNLKIRGTAASDDEAAVTTSAKGLASPFQANGQPITLSEPLVITMGPLGR